MRFINDKVMNFPVLKETVLQFKIYSKKENLEPVEYCHDTLLVTQEIKYLIQHPHLNCCLYVPQ